MARQWQVTMYCHDAAAQSAFWAAALGYIEQPPPAGFDTWEEALLDFGLPEDRLDEGGAIIDPNGEHPRIFFHKVPEAKPDQMNRLHLDLRVTGPDDDEEASRAAQDAERDRLVGLGASVVGRVHDLGGTWIVMRDPEGNEFCLT